MLETPSRAVAAGSSSWRARALAAGAIVAAVGVAYHNSFSGPLVFDDGYAIRDNPTIRSLTAIRMVLSPPENSGVGGRPLANLTFALNHAFGGVNVRGYHALNLLLHACSALLLYGIVRRTLRRWAKAMPPSRAEMFALATALLWSVHPLTTAAVTYLSQRTELLMAVCYLGTLWCFMRWMETGAWAWRVASMAACVAGMMSKEVMVSAPVAVLLYDRAFVAGSFAQAWRQRRGYYIALGASWLVLAYLVAATGLEQRTVGFGQGVSPWAYALTEAEAWARYAALPLWPARLVFDYGPVYASGPLNVVGALLVLGLFGVAIRGLRKNSATGFLVACVVLLLAPTSSFVPVADQPIAENRMYLPLAATVVLLVTAVQRVLSPRACLVATLLALPPMGALTVLRNGDYADALVLWRDTLEKRPQNHRAHFNHGVLLLERGRAVEAAASFERAIQLRPDYPEAHTNFGNVLLELGRVADATRHYAEATQLQPSSARAWYNHGNALLRAGNTSGAREHLERALQLNPRYAEAHNQIGNAFFQSNQPARAIEHYEAALRIDAALAEARYNCGSACLELGRVEEAVGHFTAAAQLQPNDAEIRNNLGAALLRANRTADAIAAFEQALRLKPDYADARSNLELARAGGAKR